MELKAELSTAEMAMTPLVMAISRILMAMLTSEAFVCSWRVIHTIYVLRVCNATDICVESE